MEWLILCLAVRAAGNDGPYSDPSKTVPVDLAYKTAFEKTAAEFAQGVNQTGIDGFCLVQRIVGSPASPRLLLSGSGARITVRGSTAGDLMINRVFISRANPAGKSNDSDPNDLTSVA